MSHTSRRVKQFLRVGTSRHALAGIELDRYIAQRTNTTYASKANRAALVARQQGNCVYCLKPLPKSWHVDHMVPRSQPDAALQRYGLSWATVNDLSNLCGACPSCNKSKSAALAKSQRRTETRPIWPVTVGYGSASATAGLFPQPNGRSLFTAPGDMVLDLMEFTCGPDWVARGRGWIATGLNRAIALSGLGRTDLTTIEQRRIAEDAKREWECPHCGSTIWIGGSTCAFCHRMSGSPWD